MPRYFAKANDCGSASAQPLQRCSHSRNVVPSAFLAQTGQTGGSMKKSHLCALLFCMVAAPLFGQQKTFNWVPGSDETVSLDPGYYHAGPALQPGSRTSDVRVEIDSQQPVTVSMATAQDWNNFAQRPDAIGYLKQICVQQHIAKATYTCTPPP